MFLEKGRQVRSVGDPDVGPLRGAPRLARRQPVEEYINPTFDDFENVHRINSLISRYK